MSELERPPIDLILDRLPESVGDDYTLTDHVLAALTHNLALVNDRLGEISKVFDDLYSLTANLGKQDSDIAKQMRMAISWGRDVRLQSAIWLINAFINGLGPHAERGAKNLVSTRQGPQTARFTTEQERGPIKQSWREDARQRWDKNRFLSTSGVARLISDTCKRVHAKDPNDATPHACILKSRTREPYSLRTIRDTVADLDPKRS